MESITKSITNGHKADKLLCLAPWFADDINFIGDIMRDVTATTEKESAKAGFPVSGGFLILS